MRGAFARAYLFSKEISANMQHTQNYQLSRWEKDDRIMMEDFNADNEKIDAALKANADAVGALEVGKADAAALSKETSARTAADSTLTARVTALEQGVKFIKLGATTTTAAGQSMTVDLSGVDMSQYDAMLLLTQAYLSASGVRELVLSLNGTNAGYIISCYDEQKAGFLWLLPIGTSSVHSFGSYSGSAAVAWNSIQTLTLSCSGGTVAAGASCVLYGLKA